mgnify:CR=1 FL=1
MHKLTKLTLFCCLSLPLLAVAASPAQQLENKLTAINTLQARFKQVLKNEKGKKIQASRGRVIIKKPNRFIWKITQPAPQLILGDGKNIWIYDKDLMQVTIKPMKKKLGETPAALLSGDSEFIKKQFNVAMKKQQYILKPKKKQTNFTWIKLEFSRGKLKKMILKDKVGQISTLEFSHLKLNQPVSAKKFHFKPPKNVDVIGKPVS